MLSAVDLSLAGAFQLPGTGEVQVRPGLQDPRTEGLPSEIDSEEKANVC